MQSGLKTELSRIKARLQKREQEHEARLPVSWVDPAWLARSLNFAPDEWQARVLGWQGKRLLLLCCRQAGKSTVSALLALHHVLYYPRSLVLLVSPSLRQSSELFRKCQGFLSLLPVRPALTEDNRLSLQLQNGSRIVSLPAKEANVRGLSGASLIIEDEAARVHDDLFLVCKPMLAVSGGRHILMSTPFGRRGHFFEAWENGGPTWERVRVTAYDCPRISEEFLQEEKRTMPDLWFRSEYLTEFIDTIDQVFLTEHVQAALQNDYQPLFPQETVH